MTVGTATGRRSAGRPGDPPLLGTDAVLIPMKAFADSKRRLGDAITDSERLALVHQMAERVVAASAPLPVAVVCDDTAVADWARSHGALVVWEPGRGLNGAVEAGVEQLARMGVRQVTVAHADLPLASGLGELDAFEGVTLVPDRRDDGTNVIRVPVRSGFRFSYGPGSFARHLAECRRVELEVRVVRSASLAFDVDVPADLAWTQDRPRTNDR
jgi:2-phospho-L-lactate guanylyltransferase